jgi:hypothetical protein
LTRDFPLVNPPGPAKLFPTMKSAVIGLSVLALGAAGACAETAYQALKTLARLRGNEVYSGVVEVRGLQGSSQPRTWRVTVADPAARAGLREFEIADGSVTGERTPVARPFGPPLDLKRLNLDSPGAFSAAERVAVATRTGFDAVDYVLASGEGGQPVWALRLVDPDRAEAGRLRVSAEDGRVIETEGFAATPGSSGESWSSDSSIRDSGPEGEDASGGVSDKFKRFGRKVEDHLKKAGGSLQNFFTGRRTIDRSEREIDPGQD